MGCEPWRITQKKLSFPRMPEDATVLGKLSSMGQQLMNRCCTRPNAPKWDTFAPDGLGPRLPPVARVRRADFSVWTGKTSVKLLLG